MRNLFELPIPPESDTSDVIDSPFLVRREIVLYCKRHRNTHHARQHGATQALKNIDPFFKEVMRSLKLLQFQAPLIPSTLNIVTAGKAMDGFIVFYLLLSAVTTPVLYRKTGGS